MGYLFLSVALFCGAVKGFCGKKMSGYANDLVSASLINLVRMVACVVLSFLMVVLSGNAAGLKASWQLIAISALSGISTAAFIITWLLCVRKSAYMMLDVFLMLGTLVPIISGRFLFDEPIGLKRAAGFAVLIVAVLIMCSYNNSIKTKFTPASLALLVLCGLSNGVTDLSQKIATRTIDGLSVDVFNLYTYIFAALTLLFTLAFVPKKEIKQGRFTTMRGISSPPPSPEAGDGMRWNSLCAVENDVFLLVTQNNGRIVLYPGRIERIK